jgi:hypothetical protein
MCIVGDFNEVLGNDPALMAHVCSKFDLIDVMGSLHPKQQESMTLPYARTKHRLDYPLVSHELLPDVTHSGLYHYHKFYPSDHGPIFLGLDPALFAIPPAITPASTHGVNSTNSTSVAAFIAGVHKKPYGHRHLDKLHQLQDTLSSLTPSQIQAKTDLIDAHITRTLSSWQNENVNGLKKSLGRKSCIMPASKYNTGISPLPLLTMDTTPHPPWLRST